MTICSLLVNVAFLLGGFHLAASAAPLVRRPQTFPAWPFRPLVLPATKRHQAAVAWQTKATRSAQALEAKIKTQQAEAAALIPPPPPNPPQVVLVAAPPKIAPAPPVEARVVPPPVHVAPPVPKKHRGTHYPFAPGNCTAYVAELFPVDFNGDAAEWPANARAAGYRVDYRPEAGAVLVMNYAPLGHVAYITAVDRQGIHITEENYEGLYQVDLRIVPFNSPTIVAVIHQ